MNKKGQMNSTVGIIILVLFSILIVTALLIPFIAEKNAEGVRSCPNTIANFTSYNVSSNLCFNLSDGEGAGNETPLFTNTLGTAERSIFALLGIFFILGIIFIASKKMGFLD